MAGSGKWGLRVVALVAFWIACVAIDAWLWRSGESVMLGALGEGFTQRDPQVQCDGPLLVRAELQSGTVRFRCQEFMGGIWPFYTEFDSPLLASLFLAPIQGRPVRK